MPVVRCSLFAFALTFTGCTYVTNSDWVDKTNCLDRDGDGAVRSAACSTPGVVEDCEDDRADRAPDLEEIPYDGIDNDCDGLELVDVDGDGFPGILAADWVANDDSTRYPGVENDQLDCDDTNSAIRPNAGEVYYDGLDSNCDGADDWDADGDGYVISANLLPAGAQSYTGSLPGGDCDDTSAAVHPGVTTDALFDGIDRNCDATNEFDGDGDTWMEDEYQVAFSMFVQRYGYHGLFPANFGDCDDTDPTIHDGADDVFYDGIDSNCDLKDDFDRDEDGVILNQDLWPDPSVIYTGSLHQGDCDDEDDTVLPGALEVLGDSTDQDCDGGDDTSPLQFWQDNSFVGPRPPVVGAVDGMYVLVVAADAFNSAPHVGIALQFDAPASPGAQPDRSFQWEHGSDGAFGEQVDAEFAGDRFFVGTSQLQSTPPTLTTQLRIYPHLLDPSGDLSLSPVLGSLGSTADTYTGLDLERDSAGDLVIGACTQNIAHLQVAEDLGESFSHIIGFDETFDTASVPSSVGDSCLVTPRPPLVRPAGSPLASRPDLVLHAFTPSQHNLVFDSATDSTIVSDGTNSTLSGFTINSAVQRDGIAALTGTNPGGPTPHGVTVLHDGIPTGTYLPTQQVYWASATEHNGDLYLAAVVQDTDSDGKNDVVVVYGDPVNPVVSTLPALTSDGAAIDVDGVSVWVDDDRVLVAITGSVGADDIVGWVFLAPAE